MDHLNSAPSQELRGNAEGGAVEVTITEQDYAADLLLRHPGHRHGGRVI